MHRRLLGVSKRPNHYEEAHVPLTMYLQSIRYLLTHTYTLKAETRLQQNLRAYLPVWHLL